MSSKRRRFSGELKAKVALEALRGDRTLQEIASQHQIHPNQVGAWKRQAIEGLVEVFSKGAERRVRDHESEVRDLHAKIGELIVERVFCHAGPVDEPVDEPVGAPHDDCARPPGAEPEPTMAPAGARALLALLRAEGGERGDARADAADRRAVPEVSVLRRPSDGTSPAPRGRADRPTPGRAADAPDGASGNLSGAAHQRSAPRAPGLALSAQGLGDRATEPCLVRRHHLHPGEPRLPLPCGGHGLGEPVRPGLAAVEHAGREFLHGRSRRGPGSAYGRPEIFNTDQGSQFTSFAFTGRLQAAGIRISMDGRGRCMDNIFIERLWRSLEYEAIYLHEIADGFTGPAPDP